MLENLRIRSAGPTLALGLAVFTAPMWGANPAHPGTVNYVEGQVTLNGERLSPNSVGTTGLDNGQVLETQHGKVEILLTPGVFLRLGDSSAVRMDANGLTHTEVAVLRGNAMLEATQLYRQNDIRVADSGATTTILKKGVYDFDANQPRVAVYDGEARVAEGDSQTKVKKGKEVEWNGGGLTETKFDRNAHDDLYNWSYVRSEYLADASAASARNYIVDPGGWYGAGWYWNPWFSAYSFIPGDGILYSPFGWGFYSPAYIGYSPLYFGGSRGFARGSYAGVSRVGNFAAVPRTSMGVSRGFSVPMRHR